jgi:hypothetical protein
VVKGGRADTTGEARFAATVSGKLQGRPGVEAVGAEAGLSLADPRRRAQR